MAQTQGARHDEEGYAAMMSIPEDVMRGIVELYMTGSVTRDTAIQKLHEAASSDDRTRGVG